LSETPSAQQDFRTILTRWFEQDEASRPLLRPSLERFLAQHPRDPRGEDVKVLLAWVSIVEGDHAAAERLIAAASASRSPSVRDLAEMASARLLLARQQPQAALFRLTRLESKLVDPAERLLCSELRLEAALESRRYAEALLALVSYLGAAPAELGDRARARAEATVKGLPASALEASLSSLDVKARRATLTPPDVWLRRVVRERLIRVAVQNQDARLARRLLDSHPGLARRSDLSAELLQLAASAGAAGQPVGGFVGLALELGDADAERRSASVARGLSEALSASLPGVESLPIVVKASAASDVPGVLSQLADAGALALVAGVSDTSAELSAGWAKTAKAPVLVVVDTPELVLSELSFVLGTSEMDQLDAIRKELERRSVVNWVRVGSGGVDCLRPAERAGQPRFPVGQWQSEAVSAVAVLGPRSCVLELFQEARGQRPAPLLAIGLEGAEALSSVGGRRFSLGSGSFPTSSPGPDVPVDFYQALGRDAGALVHGAWTALGGPRGEDAAVVQRRLPEALARLEVELETTEAKGFAGKRRLPRALSVREAP
jgi:hypothetical protein